MPLTDDDATVPALQTIGAPVPADAPHHIPSATVLLGADLLLTSWVEGRASTRLGVLDLPTGTWTVVRGLRGMLRDAVLLADGRALVLEDHALVEIDLATLTVARRLTSSIGRYNEHVRVVDAQTVAVGSSARAMETLVSMSDLTAVRKQRRPRIAGTSVPHAAARAGVVRVLGGDAGLLLGATDARATAPQRLVVLSAVDFSEQAVADMPTGLSSAHVVHDGVVAASPDLGQARGLTAVTALRPRASGEPRLADLATAGTASATALLTPGPRRAPARTIVRDRTLALGSVLADVTARKVTLDGCRVAHATRADERPRIERVTVTDLELRSSSVSGAVLEDVTVHGLRTPHESGFVRGCELRRVTLTGRVRGLVLDATMSDLDPETEVRTAAWFQDRLQDPEWMLDLTEATGDITLRGYPSRFVRRNPQTQAVVTAEAVATHDWRAVDHGRSALRVAVLELARSGWEDVVLVADTHGPRAADDLQYIQRLRDAGVAEQD